MYLQTFSKPYKSVCVKECPKFDYNAIKYNQPANIIPEIKEDGYPGALYYNDFARKYGGLSKTKSPHMTEEEAFSFNKEFINGYFTEEQWHKYLGTVDLKCKTNNEFSSCKASNTFHIYDSYPVLDTVCVPKAPKTSLLFNKVSSKFDHGRVGDMVDAYDLFIYCALIGLGLSLVFLILICMCTTMITWILLLGLVLVLFAFGVFVLINLYWTGPLNDGVNAARVKYLSFIF